MSIFIIGADLNIFRCTQEMIPLYPSVNRRHIGGRVKVKSVKRRDKIEKGRARGSAWLERPADNRKVGGSNPPGPTFSYECLYAPMIRLRFMFSSLTEAGRLVRGAGFEPAQAFATGASVPPL